ncbi:MAG: site-specific integrase [Intestinibacter bartlettii]|nr:site-specific integrase [Intestinibacter bartlettii]
MIENLLTDNYVKNIPWKKTPRRCFMDDNNKYEEAFKSVLEYVPNSDNKITYSENVWDFNEYYKDINSNDYKIDFNKASEDYCDYLKMFVIYKITQKSKVSTIKVRIINFISIISAIKSTQNKPFTLITTDDIKNEIESRDIILSTKHNLYVATYLIYEFIIKNYELSLLVDINELHKKSAEDRALSKKENTKIPNIPEDYYSVILSKAIETLDNEKASYNRRMTAGLIIIESQTGLRTQDLLGLKVSDIHEKKLPVSDIMCNYLHFQTRKPSKAHSDMLEFDIYASQLCADAFNKMSILRQKCVYRNEPYLYVLDSGKKTSNKYPIATNRLQAEYRKFFLEELKDLTCEKWKGITPVKHVQGGKTYNLNIPEIRQYRVHLATALYNNGVSLNYIKKYLGHLSEYMLGYYVRPKNPGHENAKYAERIVKKIAGDDMTPLGSMGAELKQNLQQFIEEGKYNVKSDTSKILNDLGENLVIREKGPGLCCIKTSIIPCKYDARTDKMLCAFGTCPNIFHFFDMINVSYMQFHELQNSYQQNKDNGFKRAAEKELNKLKSFCKGRLTPELDELERVVKTKGLSAFVKQYPDLQYYATNIDNIRKEIQLWENY